MEVGHLTEKSSLNAGSWCKIFIFAEPKRSSVQFIHWILRATTIDECSEYAEMSKSRRIGCMIPHCNLRDHATYPSTFLTYLYRDGQRLPPVSLRPRARVHSTYSSVVVQIYFSKGCEIAPNFRLRRKKEHEHASLR